MIRHVDGLPTPGRTLVMGVVNVTADSFSDGGRWLDPQLAVQHGRTLVEEGADIVDVGGESTRPGALRVDPDEELRRVIPVVRRLAQDGVIVSVDTMRADVASAALEAGARIINDVSGGLADPRMTSVAAAADVPFVVMHWRQHSASMQKHTAYDDLLTDVIAELQLSVDAAVDAGVSPQRIIVDPGLGFSKTGDQNWTLLHALDRFEQLGSPLLVAASRKRFLGELLADSGVQRPPLGRDAASAAVTALSAAAGAWCVRVHEVAPSADAVRVVERWTRG